MEVVDRTAVITFVMLLFASEFWPRRAAHAGPYGRWLTTAALFALGLAAVELMRRYVLPHLPSAPVWSTNAWRTLPTTIAVAVLVVIIDFWKYWEHRAYHHFAVLWRLHQVHHTDSEFDVTTDLRHHPLEALVSAAIFAALMPVLGGPSDAVLYALLAFRLASCFSHANLGLPEGLDRALRAFVVTPDYHRIHHSTRREQTDSNYAALLPLWDRLFATRQVVPHAEQVAIPLGLESFATPRSRTFSSLIVAPFRQRAR